MKYRIISDEFEGLQCDWDAPIGSTPTLVLMRDFVILFLLICSIAAIAMTGVYSIFSKDYVPVLGVWGVTSPVLTLIVKRYLGPTDGPDLDDRTDGKSRPKTRTNRSAKASI